VKINSQNRPDISNEHIPGVATAARRLMIDQPDGAFSNQ